MSGDEALPPSFEEFFIQNRDPLYRALCLITRNSHEAEELMQESFVRIYERWDHVGVMDDPVGYLYRTSMNAFRMLRRRTLVAAKHLIAVVPRDDELDNIEQQDHTIRALGALSPRQRAVVVLVDMLQFRPDEVGEMLGLKASTVRVHLVRARSALEPELRPRDE